MFQDGLSVLTVLLFIIGISEWLSDKPYFKHVSTGLMVILLGALASNLGIIPASTPAHPIYDAVFEYIAPISMFLILLGVNLGNIKKAGKFMLVMFAIGAAATMVATLIVLMILAQNLLLGSNIMP